MDRNSLLLLAVLLVVAFLVSTIFGPLIIAGVVIIFIIALVIVQSNKTFFNDTNGHDHRFKIRRLQTVVLENYGVKVKLTNVSSPRPALEANTPRVVTLQVEKEGKAKKLFFDANNFTATRAQAAFGVEFSILDSRNDSFIFAADKA